MAENPSLYLLHRIPTRLGQNKVVIPYAFPFNSHLGIWQYVDPPSQHVEAFSTACRKHVAA